MTDSTNKKNSCSNSSGINIAGLSYSSDRRPVFKSPKKIGKGHKYCKQCKAVIGARCASCKNCKFVYPFKGKKRAKPESSTKRLVIQNSRQIYKHATFPKHIPNKEAEEDTFKQDHSSFMKTKPYFVDIEPKQKQYMDTSTIDSYIDESRLLLDSASEQISKYGDLESAAKILNRSLINLTFLATLCDSNEQHGDKCPDLNDFL